MPDVHTRVRPRARLTAVLVSVLVIVGGFVVIPAGVASADIVNGFVNSGTSTDLGGSGGLTNFVFLPTGNMIALGKCGKIERIAPNGSAATLTTIANTPCDGDRGVVGIALDANYATNGNVFLLYDYTSGGKDYGKLAVWTVDNANTPNSLTYQRDLMNALPSFSTVHPGDADDSHTVGTVLVAPDGTLFVGNGDASSYNHVDTQALDAQNIASPRGKIFHINPDGSPAAGDIPGSYQNSVYAYGFRNPFRFTLKPGSSTVLYAGDVGFDTTEEVDVVNAGKNYGWPCYEGNSQSNQNIYGEANFNTYQVCKNLYAAGPGAVVFPLTSWSHTSVGGSSASIGGVFYTGTSYPAAYQNAFFFGDYASNHIWTVKTDLNTDALVRDKEANGFANGGDAEGPVAFRIGPQGDVYWADIVNSTIYHLQNATLPVAVATADTPVGGTPLTVHFDGSKSGVPAGHGIAYSWDFGDGTPGSTAPSPVHTYTTIGKFNATLTVRDTSTNNTDTASVPINTTNHVPVVTAALSPPGLTYAVGDTVTIKASATDVEDGVIPPSSLSFQTILHHCPVPTSCHIHPGQVVTGTNGTYTFAFPNHGDNVFDEVIVTATDSQGVTSSTSVDVNTATSVFTAVAPYRLLDTRPTGQLTPGHQIVLDMSTQPNQPGEPNGVMLNVTATNPAAAGYVRAYPCGTTPTNSTVNFDPGQTAANLAQVSLSADRKVCLSSLVPTDVIVDMAGWYSAPFGALAGAAYTTVDPVRVLDTRTPALAPGGVVSKFAGGREYSFSLAGWSGFPANAKAALLNLTVTNPEAAGYVRVYPCGAEQDVSNVNYVAGQTVANLAAVQVAAGGQVCFRSYATTDLIVDLAGWYAPAGGYGAVAPAQQPRLLDTRNAAQSPTGAAAPLAANQELPVQIGGANGVPAGARAVVLNVTAANPAAAGYVRVYPCGTSPYVSNVNYRAGQVAAANLAVVKLPADGRVCFSSYASTDLVVDLAGWYVG